jgi:hypothetical protein
MRCVKKSRLFWCWYWDQEQCSLMARFTNVEFWKPCGLFDFTLVLIIALSVVGSIMMILEEEKSENPTWLRSWSRPTAPHFLPSRIAHDHFWWDLGLLMELVLCTVKSLTSGFTLLRIPYPFAMELLNVIIALSTIVVLESLQAT